MLTISCFLWQFSSSLLNDSYQDRLCVPNQSKWTRKNCLWQVISTSFVPRTGNCNPNHMTWTPLMQQLLAFDAQPSGWAVSHAPLQHTHAQTTAMLWARSITFPACKLNSTMRKHALKVRKRHCKRAEIQLFRTLPWGSISSCHRKLKYQQVLPGSPSKPFSANTTWHALYSQLTQQRPKHSVFSIKGWEAPAVCISKSDWICYKEKGQNCTCLLKWSKSMEWSHFLDFHKHFNCWNKYWLNFSQVKMQDCREMRNSLELVL